MPEREREKGKVRKRVNEEINNMKNRERKPRVREQKHRGRNEKLKERNVECGKSVNLNGELNRVIGKERNGCQKSKVI